LKGCGGCSTCHGKGTGVYAGEHADITHLNTTCASRSLYPSGAALTELLSACCSSAPRMLTFLGQSTVMPLTDRSAASSRPAKMSCCFITGSIAWMNQFDNPGSWGQVDAPGQCNPCCVKLYRQCSRLLQRCIHAVFLDNQYYGVMCAGFPVSSTTGSGAAWRDHSSTHCAIAVKSRYDCISHMMFYLLWFV
jgi:hypothetical protein